MIIYLYGPDSYQRQQKLKEIVKQYQEKHSGLTLAKFDLADGKDQWPRFEDSVKARSLFGGQRLIVISGLADWKDKKSAVQLVKFLVKAEDNTLLISEDKKLTKDFNF